MPSANDYAKLKEMPLEDLIGNALDRVGIALRDCQDVTVPVTAFERRPRLPEGTVEILARAQELLREAERRLADLTALREADQATSARLATVNKELADALIERMDITLPRYWRAWDGKLNDENDPGGHYRRIFAALRSAGRLQEPPQG